MDEARLIQAALAALVHAAAGTPIFFYAYNRRMYRMAKGMDKINVSLVFSILAMVLPAVLGWVLSIIDGVPFLVRWAYPILVGLVWLGGETRLAWQRYTLRGAPPLEFQPAQLQGLQFLTHPITTLDLTRVTYQIAWDGPDLTVVQITDLHLNERIPLCFYQEAVEMANQVNPDLIILSGDFVTHRHNIPVLTELLSPLRTSYRVHADGMPAGKAVFASLGNHDYWAGAPAIREQVQAAGARLLSGSCVDIGVGGDAVRLGGDDSPWGAELKTLSSHSPPPAGEGPGVRDLLPSIILSHTPDNIYRLARLPGCAAVFSGHVHGGQMRLPLPGSAASSTALIVPSAYGRRFDRGHFVFPSPFGHAVHLFVSAGVGAAEPALRLYCPPEVLVVRFIRQIP